MYVQYTRAAVDSLHSLSVLHSLPLNSSPLLSFLLLSSLSFPSTAFSPAILSLFPLNYLFSCYPLSVSPQLPFLLLSSLCFPSTAFFHPYTSQYTPIILFSYSFSFFLLFFFTHILIFTYSQLPWVQ